MPENRAAAPCAVCGKKFSRVLFLARDPDGLSAEPFAVVRCAVCGMVFVSPRPEPAALSRWYGGAYYDKPGAGVFLGKRVAKAAAGRAPGRVLDVGCGDGAFLAAMERRGWDAWGVEVSKEGAARAAARPGIRVFDRPLGECGFTPKSFDLITFWHSIEHVEEPEALLRRAAELLKDDGALFLAFPNAESWDFRLFGARWFHLDPPRHLHYFSPVTMGRLLEKCGLEIADVGMYSAEYNPFGFVQSCLNAVTARFNFFYRKMKGNLRPEESTAVLDIALTAILLPFLAAASVPYSLLAGLFGASGCVDVRAVKPGASAPRRGNRPDAR